MFVGWKRFICAPLHSVEFLLNIVLFNYANYLSFVFLSSFFCDNPVDVQAFGCRYRLVRSNWIDFNVYRSHNNPLVMKIHCIIISIFWSFCFSF